MPKRPQSPDRIYGADRSIWIRTSRQDDDIAVTYQCTWARDPLHDADERGVLTVADDLHRTQLHNSDIELTDAGHWDSWVPGAEATVTIVLSLTRAEIVELRRICRAQRKKPSAIVSGIVREKLQKT